MMPALIDSPSPFRLLPGLCLLLGICLPGPADAGGQANPYRLNIRIDDYKLHLPGKAAGARERPARNLAALIDRHARTRGLDPALVHAVVEAESAYRPTAVSAKGAIGLMQVMPDTGRRFGVIDLADPDANLRAGTAYLRHLLARFDDLPLALAAYNAGENAVIRHGYRIPPYPETQAYVRGILRNYGKPAARPRHPGGIGFADGVDLSPYRLRRLGN